MKQQILIIHGGNAFETHEEYLDSLRTKELSLEKLRFSDWKKRMKTELGDGFEVFTPNMPNSNNARYSEWRIIFEKLLALMDDGVILVGHSLGGILISKYLSENDCSKKIKATMLVAAPFNSATDHPLVDFIITSDLSRLAKQGGKIYLYHSKDDEVVPYSNCRSYQKALPDAIVRTLTDRGHFNDETFPEIVEDLKSLATEETVFNA